MSKVLYSLNSIHKILRSTKPSKVCIVTSEILAKRLNWAIKEIDFPKIEIVLVPDGEASKEWDELEKLLKKFVQFNLDHSSLIIALGGGTVGDVASFACAIYLRGIRYIQIPTTLLAQVDSAHGGKTGINFAGFKNQIGSFYEPITTIIDLRFVKSLPKEQIIDGLGEIIKTGFIKDPSILALLRKENISTILKSPRLRSIINKTITVKQFYIGKDPLDHGIRQILNFGHTVGHAIELKHKISHGKAVITGMLNEMTIGESLHLTSPLVRQNLVELLKRFEIKMNNRIKPDWKTILHDKKIAGDAIMFPVIEREGKSRLVKLKLDKFKQLLGF